MRSGAPVRETPYGRLLAGGRYDRGSVTGCTVTGTIAQEAWLHALQRAGKRQGRIGDGTVGRSVAGIEGGSGRVPAGVADGSSGVPRLPAVLPAVF